MVNLNFSFNLLATLEFTNESRYVESFDLRNNIISEINSTQFKINLFSSICIYF